MSYLLDKKTKRKKVSYIISCIILFLVLLYFRSGIFNGLAYASNKIFRPVLVAGDNLGTKFSGLSAYFSSKNSLYQENQNLQSQLLAQQATMANYNSVLADDADLKNILGNKSPKAIMTLVAILSKPNQSPYDTLLIDAGTNEGIKAGDTVFAIGNIPIGRIADLYPESAKVILFSNPGEQTQVAISGKNIFTQVVGRGGGNFEIVMPTGFTMSPGNQVVLPGITPYVVGTVQTILSDPRDSFTKALLASPVNIQELKFVEVEE